jgi:hypothetical protein
MAQAIDVDAVQLLSQILFRRDTRRSEAELTSGASKRVCEVRSE